MKHPLSTDVLYNTCICTRRTVESNRWCIATIADDRVVGSLVDFLDSLRENGDVAEASVVIFGVYPNMSVLKIANRYNAAFVQCRSMIPINSGVKAVLYSAPMWINASYFVCMDADTVVLKSIRGLFCSLENISPDKVLVTDDICATPGQTLEEAYQSTYGGKCSDLDIVFNCTDAERRSQLIVNDGVFGGSAASLLSVDSTMREMRGAAEWASDDGIPWRNQFVFNLAIARLKCGVRIDHSYNVQLHKMRAERTSESDDVSATWTTARVLHFSGLAGKSIYNAIRHQLR